MGTSLGGRTTNTRLLVEQLLNGLITGAMYALVASGLSLVWGSLRVLNFAHGEFYMLGGYATYWFFARLGLAPVPAILLSVAVVGVVGALVERLAIDPLLDRPAWETGTIITTIGASIILQNLALRVWGERFKNVPYFASGTVTIGGVAVATQRLAILVVATLVILVGTVFLKNTRLGMALRATAQDRVGAVLMGVHVRRVYSSSVAISAGLAALAAAMLAPIASVNPWMGASLLLKAFAVCVLGGLGNLMGAIAAGILLGVTESITVVLWSSEWKDVVAYALLLLVLWIRPAGLMGSKDWFS